jgi:multicomponent K+:H+ antiporter subunit D
MLGLARAGSALFWKTWDAAEPYRLQLRTAVTVPAWALFGLLVLLTAFAGPATAYAEAAAEQLFARDGYIGAVMGPERSGR